MIELGILFLGISVKFSIIFGEKMTKMDREDNRLLNLIPCASE